MQLILFVAAEEKLLTYNTHLINQIPFGTINQVELGIILEISLN